MSDLDVQDLLDELERMLQEGDIDGEALANWRARLDGAVGSADRGAEWPRILQRSRALAARLDREADKLTIERERLRRELEFQGQGARALKGYKPS